jgi:hypothetical protein
LLRHEVVVITVNFALARRKPNDIISLLFLDYSIKTEDTVRRGKKTNSTKIKTNYASSSSC